MNNTSISLYEPLSSNGNKAFLELKNEIEKNQRLSNSSLYNLSKLINYNNKMQQFKENKKNPRKIYFWYIRENPRFNLTNKINTKK